VDSVGALYGWTIDTVLNHTFYQIDNLLKQAARRKYQEDHRLVNMMRTAYHADRDQFDRFIDSLKPDSVKEQEESAIVAIPDGLAYTET